MKIKPLIWKKHDPGEQDCAFLDADTIHGIYLISKHWKNNKYVCRYKPHGFCDFSDTEFEDESLEALKQLAEEHWEKQAKCFLNELLDEI